jgi:cyclopropane-fatty-acyl-phospholipid synthase
VERVENIGGHYAKALRLWRKNFLLHFDDKIMPALLDSHPTMSKKAVEVFRRKWEVGIFQGSLAAMKAGSLLTPHHNQYYFAYCEAGFITKTLGDVIITVGRAGALELMEGIPL